MLQVSDNGVLTANVPGYEKLFYDISNKTVLAQADGSFGISKYAVAGYSSVFEENSFYAALSINNLVLPCCDIKQIEMCGRQQIIHLKTQNANIKCKTFLDDEIQAVFQEFVFESYEKCDALFKISFGFLLANSKAPVAALSEQNGYSHKIDLHRIFTLASDANINLREIEGCGVHYEISALLKKQPVTIKLVYSLQNLNNAQTAQQLLEKFKQAAESSSSYNNYLQAKICGENAVERSLYLSALNCALSSYKQVGDFKGFYAGVNYQSPPRTYYRDGYFTALPVLKHKPLLVRNEILTLALGVADNGACPSAVIDEATVFWENHLDSPAFFVMMLHDYLACTKDFELLKEIAGGKTILQKMLFAVDSLLLKADKTGLIYRESFNRHDWVDNIYREGYVTYIQALFYRAVYCAGKILKHLNDSTAVKYFEQADKIKKAIQSILWNDEKGWFNNYQSENCIEDNLSVDTVLTIVFDIATPEQSEILLSNMEKWLESRNNSQQPFGDWGTLCCYPCYKFPQHLVEKSSYPFVYHNGSDWPYWSAMYGFAKGMKKKENDYPICRWFTYALEKNWATPVEYYNPITGRGSLLQGWSGMAAFAIEFKNAAKFPFNL